MEGVSRGAYLYILMYSILYYKIYINTTFHSVTVYLLTS